jgi:hypothetical protein
MSVIASITVTAVAVKVGGLALLTAGKILADLLRNRRQKEARPELLRALQEVPETTQQIGPPPNVRGQDLGAALVKVARLGVDDPEGLRRHLEDLPVERWPEAVVNFGQASFLRRTTDALLRACRTIGFDRVSVRDDRRGGVRVIAEDPNGRALVTEVNPHGHVRTEVLGVSDATCHRIMEDFMQALRKEGLEFRIEDRRWTGGIPQTDAGVEWACRSTRAEPHEAVGASQEARPRRRPNRPKIRIGA